MLRLHSSIGARLIALTLTLGWTATTVDHAVALTSTSYQLNDTFGGYATGNGGDSANYVQPVAGATWYVNTLKSTSYQLANSNVESGTSSSGGGTTGGAGAANDHGSGTSGTTYGHGSRGDRAGHASSHPAAPGAASSSSLSSSRSRIPVEHPSASEASASSASAIETQISSSEEGAGGVQRGVTHVSFFDAVSSEPCTVMNRIVWMPWTLAVVSILVTMLNGVLLARGMKWKTRTTKEKRRMRRIILLAILGALSAILAMLIPLTAHATNQTTPLLRSYNGTLLDSAGNPVTTAVTVRFSYWKSADYLTSDTTGTGAIDTGAANYVGWKEVQTVTPTSKGSFSLNLGAVTPLINLQNLPASTLNSLFLQVEVKPSGSADTSYEVLDVDSSNSAIDRSQITSVPFARNADLLDQHDTGSGSGDIPVLDFGGHIPLSAMGSGTNLGTFVLDADNSETSQISLEFGTSLGKKLTYDITNNTFVFNASLKVQGNLTVNGLINGVDISSLSGLTDALKASSGGGLNLNVFGGSYRLDGNVVNYAGGSRTLAANATNYVFFGSGGLVSNVAGFPTNQGYIPVAQVTTSAGAILTVVDRRITTNDDRERAVVNTFTPNFEKASYQGDGADNVGQLSVSSDNITLNNFYVWSSTKTLMQDYDLLLRVPVSSDFVRWKSDATTNPLSFNFRTTSASNAENKLDIQVYDTNGVPVTLSGSVSNLAGTSWTTAQAEFTGTPTWTAGQDMLIRIKFSAKDAYQAQLGSLKLQHIDLVHE